MNYSAFKQLDFCHINSWPKIAPLRLLIASFLIVYLVAYPMIAQAEEKQNGKDPLDNYPHISKKEAISAIKFVKNHKLKSGRTIEEELEKSFPSVIKSRRHWEAHRPHKKYESIFVEYIIEAGKEERFKPLIWKWQVYLDDGKLSSVSGENDIAIFLEQADESIRREKILSKFSKEEQRIFRYFSIKYDVEYTGKRWIEYREQVRKEASRIFKMKSEEAEAVYNKIHKAMFGQ